MGVSEAAAFLGVSRQRVSQLRTIHPQLPEPVAHLSTGPVWLTSQIEAFARIPRPAGRPKKETSMAPPTEDQVLGYIDKTAARLAPDGQHVLFEWRGILDSARRAHDSTSQAIEKRMVSLVERGDLRKICVSHDGYVYLRSDSDFDAAHPLYFKYQKRASYEQGAWGFVTDRRPENRQNLWANGNRYLYATKPRWEKMVQHFDARRTELVERRRQKRAAAEAKLWGIIEARDPDARQVLKQLAEAVPGVQHDMMLLGTGRPVVEIGARGADEVSALLAVLRRGLESAP